MVGIRTAIHQGGIWDTGKKQPAGLQGKWSQGRIAGAT